jgi:hypothetical protein
VVLLPPPIEPLPLLLLLPPLLLSFRPMAPPLPLRVSNRKARACAIAALELNAAEEALPPKS